MVATGTAIHLTGRGALPRERVAIEIRLRGGRWRAWRAHAPIAAADSSAA